MDDLEPKSSPTPSPMPSTSGLEELRNEYAALTQLVTSALILMIVVSGALNLFLLRQTRYARQDLNNLKPQISQMVADYNKVNAPAINDFAGKLVEFGKKNPDFMPIVMKYGLMRTGAAPATATGPIPATNRPVVPAAPAAPAKK